LVTPDDLADMVAHDNPDIRFVVLTGGEPTLQDLGPLVELLHRDGFFVAMETNGSRPWHGFGVDWVTVSPKQHVNPAVPFHGGYADELKVVYSGAENLDVYSGRLADFERRYIQPMDGKEGATAACVAYVMANPAWRLSVQVHKLVGVR
jgi:organic radical activating enzyme